jgi:hypothetical protein
MKVKVTETGVVVPKEMLEGFEEVEITKEGDRIIIFSVTPTDPIFALGTNPVLSGIDDAAEKHDSYIYGGN